MGVEKAFVFFFNDGDEPGLHAASGLTRNFQPKPAFHAVAWMLHRLRDYRFSRIVQASLTEGYVYEFTPEKPGAPVILAVWRATGEGAVKLPAQLGSFRAERIPLRAGPAEEVVGEGAADSILAGPRPILLEKLP
jgi:hypothetical protein